MSNLSVMRVTQKNSEDLPAHPIVAQQTAPGSPAAAPVETARAQVNMALNEPQSVMPARDGIFGAFIAGAAAAKAKGLQRLSAIASSWGLRNFWVLALASSLALAHAACYYDPTELVEAGNTTAIADIPSDVSAVNGAICNPFGNANHAGAGFSHGIVARLQYLTDDMPRYYNVVDYMAHGVPVDASIYFGKIDVPTRPFDRGFVTNDNQTILNAAGTTLYEYFSLRFQSKLRLQDATAPRRYQFALIADDGANLYVDSGAGYQLVVDDDGTHPSRLGCATVPVTLDFSHGSPIRVDYYQGPRYHIAVILLWRPWLDDVSFNPNDPLCGMQGNGLFFNSGDTPPTPQAAYNQLLARGWSVVPEELYELPDEVASNPCNAVEPMVTQITSVVPADAVTRSTQATFTFASNRADATFQCSLDGAAFAACATPKTYSGLLSGAHQFSVRAVDGAGNFDATGASYAWTVDISPPIITSEGVTVTSNSMTVAWTTNEPSTTSLLWGLGGVTNQTVPDNGVFSTSHSVTVTGLAADTVYSYRLVGTDRAGNTVTSSRRATRTNP